MARAKPRATEKCKGKAEIRFAMAKQRAARNGKVKTSNGEAKSCQGMAKLNIKQGVILNCTLLKEREIIQWLTTFSVNV